MSICFSGSLSLCFSLIAVTQFVTLHDFWQENKCPKTEKSSFFRAKNENEIRSASSLKKLNCYQSYFFIHQDSCSKGIFRGAGQPVG